MTTHSNDQVRQEFEAWFSEEGQWPHAIERRGNLYVLAQAQSAWETWQDAWSAALAQAPQAVPLREERYLEALRSIFSARSIHDARHVVVHTLGTELLRQAGITGQASDPLAEGLGVPASPSGASLQPPAAASAAPPNAGNK